MDAYFVELALITPAPVVDANQVGGDLLEQVERLCQADLKLHDQALPEGLHGVRWVGALDSSGFPDLGLIKALSQWRQAHPEAGLVLGYCNANNLDEAGVLTWAPGTSGAHVLSRVATETEIQGYVRDTQGSMADRILAIRDGSSTEDAALQDAITAVADRIPGVLIFSPGVVARLQPTLAEPAPYSRPKPRGP